MRIITPAVLAILSTSLMFAALLLQTEAGVTPWVVLPLALLGLGGCAYAGHWERKRTAYHWYLGYRARERAEATEYTALAAAIEELP